MSTWGKQGNEDVTDWLLRVTNSRSGGPGWYPVPGRPGLEAYWDGHQWSPDVPPRPEPEPMWKRAWPVTAGVVAAVVLLALLF